MKKIAGLLAVVFVLAMLVCYGAAATFATTDIPADPEEFMDMVYGMMEEPVDYDGLFALSDGVDGAFAEGYYYEMNQLFDRNPDAFLDALSEQSYEKNSHFAFILAGEHMQNWDTYRTTLEQSGAGEETLFLMRMGILVVQSNTKYSDLDFYENTYPQQVMAHYQENKRLFLLGMPEVGESFYFNVVDALVVGLDDAQLQELWQDLSAVDGLTEGAVRFVDVVHQKIEGDHVSDVPDVPEEPDIPELPDAPEQPDDLTDETEPSAPTQTAPDADASKEEIGIPAYVWIVGVVAVIGIAAVVVIKKR